MGVALLSLWFCCGGCAPPVSEPGTAERPPMGLAPLSEPELMAAREQMVEQQLRARDIVDPRVLDAMRQVPRHLFIPEKQWEVAYYDGAVGIGYGQTISQPYIVAFMSQAMAVRPGMRVLEVGTGSGYQAAILSSLGAEVWSIEILPPLARRAQDNLLAAGFPVVDRPEVLPAGTRGPIHLRQGDGYRGWSAAEGGGAPYDRILVTASPDHVPPALVEQLGAEGRMILPIGDDRVQQLVILERGPEGLRQQEVLPVLFVPMTGEAEGH